MGFGALSCNESTVSVKQGLGVFVTLAGQLESVEEL